MKNIAKVSVLRLKKFEDVEEKQGVYRWWFEKNVADSLLTSFSATDKQKICQQIIDGKTYYALYFGISSDLRMRIRWHANQKHTQSAVWKGFLSTLRQTLCALTGKDMLDPEAKEFVDNLMDSCYWEWEEDSNYKATEYAELTQTAYCYPLNLQNNHTVCKKWLESISKLRKLHRH